MANTFRERKQEVQAEKPPQQPLPPKAEAKPQPAPKRAVQNKSVTKGIRLIRKGFENVFGGGVLLKIISLRKNWKFLLTIVVMIIILIYSNLQVQSKRDTISNLNKEIIVAKGEAMDAIEEGYNIDKQKEREVLQEGEEKGFYNSGYIPYIINND